MVTVHMIVGTLVLLGYLSLTVVNVLAIGGHRYTWERALSFAAATLLLIQYALGFSLLGSDHDKSGWHYAFALAALITVGLEHGLASRQPIPEARARVGVLASAGTLVLVLIAFVIGESS